MATTTIPILCGWSRNVNGTLSGYLLNSSNFDSGTPITTSAILLVGGELPRLVEGSIVQTKSGSRYILGDAIGPSSSTSSNNSNNSSINNTSEKILKSSHCRFSVATSFFNSLKIRRLGRLTVALICVQIFVNALSSIRSSTSSLLSNENEESNDLQQQLLLNRDHCQIIYIVGVEGSVHHGITPIIQHLASIQNDVTLTYPNRVLRSAIFGFSHNDRSLTDPTMVRDTIHEICPPLDNKHHVIIEDLSFPSGAINDKRTYRIHRQTWWYTSSMEQIALSETALNHPTNLQSFVQSYSPYANIKFIVLHRPYIETIISHAEHDGGLVQHSNVIRGYLLLLRRFLDSIKSMPNIVPINGGRERQQQQQQQLLWTLLCVEQLKLSHYNNDVTARDEARKHILIQLANFLGWNYAEECNNCYNHWIESTRDHVAELGSMNNSNNSNVGVLLEHMRTLTGIWPPEMEDALPEQKCSL